MKNVILIAPPAGGKGTQSDMICSKYKMPHISTGDLLRAASEEDNERGRFLKEQLKTGKLIDDNIIFDLIQDRINKNDCENGYVLDGFPRNIEQAEVYDKILMDLNKDLGCVILLDTPKELASKRISGRLSCSKCGRVYNSVFEEMKPINENICDDCLIPLNKREDDNEETYEVRYQTYLDKTQPLIDYYINKGNLYKIDASYNKEDTFKKIEEIIRGE